MSLNAVDKVEGGTCEPLASLECPLDGGKGRGVITCLIARGKFHNMGRDEQTKA